MERKLLVLFDGDEWALVEGDAATGVDTLLRAPTLDALLREACLQLFVRPPIAIKLGEGPLR